MPMIVDLSAPHVTPPSVVTSPDGWLSAVVDDPWAGVLLGYDAGASPPLTDVAQVRRVRVVRQDPGATAPVAVRSADAAWAIEGVGAAYDHEAPLGVAVVYTATPVYADGTTGPDSSLAVTVPEPTAPADVWIKSLDEPGLSARVTVRSWPTLKWASRIDSVTIAGSPYPATSQDVYAAADSSMLIDAQGEQISLLEELLTTPGVRIVQTRPDYLRPDQYVLFSDPEQTIDSIPTQSRSYSVSVQQVARPNTANQPLRIPGWSYDMLAAGYASYDAAAATFSSYLQLATNGRLG